MDPSNTELTHLYVCIGQALERSEGGFGSFSNRNDPLFKAVHDKLDAMIDPILFVGRAPEQVDEFLAEEIDPILSANAELLKVDSVDAVNV